MDDFANLQRAYAKCPTKAARTVLSGTWASKTAQIDIGALRRHWTDTLSSESQPDSRTVEAKPCLWQTAKPITSEDVVNNLRGVRGAPGPDRITWPMLKDMNPAILASVYNIWMVLGQLPDRMLLGVTTLIPKTEGSQDPAKFRPITVTSTVARLYDRILGRRLEKDLPLDNAQRGFRSGDGMSVNVRLLEAVLKRTTQAYRPLAGCFLDVKGAFDRVSHESMLLACERLGVPPPLLSYFSAVSAGSKTRLKYDGRIISPSITVGRGVPQGKPSSCVLFNAVIDWCVSELDNRLGVELGGRRLTHLLFADDSVLVAESPKSLQYLLQSYEGALAKVGLELNAAKSAAFMFHTNARKKIWTPDLSSKIVAGGEPMRSLGLTDTYRYLGLEFSVGGIDVSKVEADLVQGLERIKLAPLRPQQRLAILKQNLLPKLEHVLVLGVAGRTLCGKLDTKVRSAVQRWLHWPANSKRELYHASVLDGGLGIQRLEFTIAVKARKRLETLSAYAVGGDVEAGFIVGEPPFTQALARVSEQHGIGDIPVVDKVSLRLANATALHGSADGIGLTNHAETPASSDWLSECKLSGSEFVRYTQLRAGILPTPARRKRISPSECSSCQLCGQNATLAHILQVCDAVKPMRQARHNAVCAQLASRLRARRFTVTSEPKVVTEDGTKLCPDLAFLKGSTLYVWDVAVVGDSDKAAERVTTEKCAKYGAPEVVEAMKRQFKAQDVNVGAIVINWRGTISHQTMGNLESVGISRLEAAWLVVKTLKGSNATYTRWSNLARGRQR